MPQNDLTMYSFFLNFLIGPFALFTWFSILTSVMFFTVFNMIKHNLYINLFRVSKILKAQAENIQNFSLVLCFWPLPSTGDLGFQNAATGLMQSLISLHHDIMFFEIIVLTVVLLFFCFIIFWYTANIVEVFGSTNQMLEVKRLAAKKQSLSFTHAAFLEIVWTTFPAFLLICIAIPSILLIFRTGKSATSVVTIKCVGNQWFWHFDYIASSLDTIGLCSNV